MITTGILTSVPVPGEPNTTLIPTLEAAPTKALEAAPSPTIVHWDGEAWLDSPSPTAVGLSSVWMLSTDEGWAVGQGAILHYEQTAPGQLYLPLVFHNNWVCLNNSIVNGSFEQDDAGWQIFTSGTDWKAHDLILRFASYNDNYFYSWFDLDEVSLCGR